MSLIKLKVVFQEIWYKTDINMGRCNNKTVSCKFNEYLIEYFRHWFLLFGPFHSVEMFIFQKVFDKLIKAKQALKNSLEDVIFTTTNHWYKWLDIIVV